MATLSSFALAAVAQDKDHPLLRVAGRHRNPELRTPNPEAFTEIMPKHHEGAIMMANHELRNGSNAGLKAIAREIANTQTRERKQLMAMHKDLSGTEPMISSETGRRRMAKD